MLRLILREDDTELPPAPLLIITPLRYYAMRVRYAASCHTPLRYAAAITLIRHWLMMITPLILLPLLPH